MSYSILDNINSAADIKELSYKEIEGLCDDIRAFLVEKVGESGGHLASNLGVTELSVALHRVFDSPKDHIIFDVGHQSYVHKILTGRKDRFSELRRPGGLSGFTLMRESEHDAFGAGHSSTSISASLGYAEADKLRGLENYTVCVIGDGAYTGGMVHEAINNCKSDLRLIIILNENGMSISNNKGMFASYLSRVRLSESYRSMKNGILGFLSRLPLIGKGIRLLISGIKAALKKIFFRTNYFEDLGFYYIGPIDGNDYRKVEKALQKAKRVNKCVFVHLKTTKGKGCDEAEREPDTFHSVSQSEAPKDTFHSIFADKLISLADTDDKVVAITAAMGIGTGLNKFEEKYPSRYFDVGIAEEHALTFAAGLAADGMKPFSAIYSTFLQRGYDNIVHDIALQGLPVKLMIDRAGISSADGATHHGIFDVSFLSHIPGIEIFSPALYSSLTAEIDYACASNAPVAVRYANAKESARVRAHFEDSLSLGLDLKYDFDVDCAPGNIFVTYGQLTDRVLRAKEMLSDMGIDVGIVMVERIKPYKPTVDFLAGIIRNGTHIVYAEEGIKNGGAAMICGSYLRECVADNINYRYDIAAIDDNFLAPDTLCDIYEYAGLDEVSLANYFLPKDK